MTTDILRAQLEVTRVTPSRPQATTGHAIGGRLSSPVVHLGSTFARWQRRLGLLPDVVL